MKFKIHKINKKIEITDLVSDLIKVSELLGKAPTMAEYNSHGNFETSVFVRRFGSWNNALSRVGLNVNNRQWTEIELLENIKSVWEQLGKQPTRRDMDKKEISKISSGAYLRVYKTWLNALLTFEKYMSNKNLDANIEESKVSHKTTRDINLRLRYLILKRDNFKCCICGRSPATTPNLELHIDHIKPWSKGGETVIENLQTLCSDCNLGKSNL